MIGSVAQRIRGVFGSGFAWSALLLVGGNALSQILVVATTPVLTRLYGPSEFGIFSIYSSVIAVLLVFATLRYDLAIPLPSSDETAAALLSLSLFSVHVIGLLTCVFLLPSQGRVLGWLNVALEPYWWIFPLGVLGSGTYQAITFWGIRTKRFGELSQTRLTQSFLMILVQAVGGLLVAGPFGLLVGDLVGRFSGIARLARSFNLRGLLAFKFRPICEVARAYSKFPCVLLWAALLNALALQVPFLLFPRLIGTEHVGEYFLSYRVLLVPVSMLATSVSHVFLAEMARDRGTPRARELTIGVTTMMAAIGLPFYAGVAILGTDTFKLVFGSHWGEAGYYARWLAPAIFLRLIANTLSTLLTVGQRFGESLLFTALEISIVLLAIWIGSLNASMAAFVVTSVVASIPLSFASLWRFGRVADLGLAELITKALVPVVLVNTPGLIVLLICYVSLPTGFTHAAWVLLAGAGYYFSSRLPQLRPLLANKGNQ